MKLVSYARSRACWAPPPSLLAFVSGGGCAPPICASPSGHFLRKTASEPVTSGDRGALGEPASHWTLDQPYGQLGGSPLLSLMRPGQAQLWVGSNR